MNHTTPKKEVQKMINRLADFKPRALDEDEAYALGTELSFLISALEIEEKYATDGLPHRIVIIARATATLKNTFVFLEDNS